MLSMSDTPIEGVLKYFADRGISVAFLVPTPTGYKKSIMDAIAPFRSFFLENGIHNYDEQQQGPENKVTFPACFVYPDRIVETSASLYRPHTKQGDPRVWFSGLKNYCNPCNLLGIVTDKKKLYVLNLSLPAIHDSLRNGGTAQKLLDQLAADDESIAMELLGKFRELHRRGFVPTVVDGDTGVGMTAEHFLEIPPNADKTPDYKGIELKCSRKKVHQPNRVNLYSQVPDWKNSRGMTAEKLLQTYGYWADDNGKQRWNLYCTVEAHRPNTQSLFFEVDADRDLLINYSMQNGVPVYVVQWSLQTLRERLLEKHRETFWVKATSIFEDGVEKFRYDSIVHTKKPTASLLGYLIDAKIITMDYTMHFKENGKVRDHGYLFKIKPENVGLLFPDPVEYILE